MRRLVTPDPPLGDGQVELRRPRAEDVSALLQIRSEDDIRERMGWSAEPLPDKDQILSNIERAARSWEEGTWAVFRVLDADSGEIAGGANLAFYDHDIAEVSYFLGSAFRGRGLATRAVLLLARWAFEENGIQRLELRTHLDNVDSMRVAERAGFTREGIERASRAAPDGTRFDSVLYSLLPDDLS